MILFHYSLLRRFHIICLICWYCHFDYFDIISLIIFRFDISLPMPFSLSTDSPLRHFDISLIRLAAFHYFIFADICSLSHWFSPLLPLPLPIDAMPLRFRLMPFSFDYWCHCHYCRRAYYLIIISIIASCRCILPLTPRDAAMRWYAYAFADMPPSLTRRRFAHYSHFAIMLSISLFSFHYEPLYLFRFIFHYYYAIDAFQPLLPLIFHCFRFAWLFYAIDYAMPLLPLRFAICYFACAIALYAASILRRRWWLFFMRHYAFAWCPIDAISPTPLPPLRRCRHFAAAFDILRHAAMPHSADCHFISLPLPLPHDIIDDISHYATLRFADDYFRHFISISWWLRWLLLILPLAFIITISFIAIIS